MSFVSYAQNYEDVMLVRALREVERGFYIDVGAQDPDEDSVTKAFYELGWHGINIEPVTYWFQRLVASRPHDINLQLAVSDSPGRLHLFEVIDSGLSTTDPDFAKRHVQDGHQIRESDVKCATLDEICKIHQVGEVHFLKIDCEGSEAAALRGLSLERIRPWIILLEATEPNSQKPAYMEWEPLLTGSGYHFVYEDGLNRFYVADERAALDSSFSHPPNVFDYFVRASEATVRGQLQATQGDLLSLLEAQRVVRAESECEQLRASVEHLRSENERREEALVEHRRLLSEAAEREAQNVARAHADAEQWRVNAEYLAEENERREAALVEHRRLLDEAAGHEAQSVARVHADAEHWRANAEYLREENERREAALVEHRRLLDEAAGHEAQSVARVHADAEQWRANAEYLREENERREAALVEHRRLLNEAVEREVQNVARMHADAEQWRVNVGHLREENVRKEQALAERHRAIATLEVMLTTARGDLALAFEHAKSLGDGLAGRDHDLALLRADFDGLSAGILRLQMEANRLQGEVESRDFEVARLRGLIRTMQCSASWRVTSPLRSAKRGIRRLTDIICCAAYHLLRWPARMMRPLIRLMARWEWLRSLAVRIAGPDSRLTMRASLFLFGDVPRDKPSGVMHPDEFLTKQAAQVLEEIQNARGKRERGASSFKSRGK
jgi:FkbM family methyltransferase